MQKIILFIISILVLGTVAYADCEYRGEIYPEGYVRGPYICGEDGKWIRR